jgi:hypothetical protein
MLAILYTSILSQREPTIFIGEYGGTYPMHAKISGMLIFRMRPIRGNMRAAPYTRNGARKPTSQKYCRLLYTASPEKRCLGPIAPQMTLAL